MAATDKTTVYTCGAARDTAGNAFRSGAVAVRDGRIIAVGEPGEVTGNDTIDLPDRLLLPAMVNAHVHLDLTAIGPQPYGGDFVDWIAMLRSHWPGDGDPWAKRLDEVWLTQAAARGAAEAKAAGVFAVGDICRTVTEADAVAAVVRGVSFVEFFGMGEPYDAEALERIAAQKGHGLQPHAPYSAGPTVFDAACASDLPVSTHLAETHDEARFVAEASGSFRILLQRIGKWRDDFAAGYSAGLSPVQWMKPYLERKPWLLAHCNYVSDDDIATLAATGASVAYCPIASEYFGHTGHRYRDMLDAGVNVCLGTDSIVCQPRDEAQPLGILAQIRRLHRRDGTDPGVLLAMATTHGCAALGVDPADAPPIAVRFDPSDPTDPLTQVLRNRYPVDVLNLKA